MRRSHRTLIAACTLPLLFAFSACGAGLIGGVASSDRRSTAPEARAPELSVTPILPLVPAPNTVQTVLVTNAQIAAAARLSVRIEAAGVVVAQRDPAATGQGGATLITFVVDTAAIQQVVGDPTAADVPARLGVWVDERPIAAAVPIVLARQPRASLVLPAGQTQAFLSPIGARVFLRVDGLRSTNVDDVEVTVTTTDPDGVRDAQGNLPSLTRVGTGLRFEPPVDGAPALSVTLPGSTHPVAARITVRDAVAGRSTTIENAWYRPDIALALPSQGPTTGGSLTTLIGTALLPFDLSPVVGGAVAGPPPFAFSRVRLSLAKGGRITQLGASDIRTAESTRDRLVFTMPPSPDGRPGQVDVILEVELASANAGTARAEVVASQVFLFANPDPFFGPRGVVLDRLPVAAVPIALDNAPAVDGAPDFVALTDQGGVGFLQLLLAEQNGMFQRFAAPRQIADHQNAAERGPRDLAVGDFDGDSVPDVFVANAGSASAVHHVVLGQPRPAPPLGAVHRFTATPGVRDVIAADFDRDGLPDVLLVPGAGAPPGQRPQVWLSRPMGPGAPSFAAPIDIAFIAAAFEAIEVADLDGDQNLDIAVATGSPPTLEVVYGDGAGAFTGPHVLAFVVPGYVPDAASPAVGLHACADGTRQSLGLVLAGLFGSGQTQPTITVLRPDPTPGSRDYLPPAAADTFASPIDPIGRSLAADIDGTPPIELVAAAAGEPLLVSLALLQFGPNGFRPVLGGVEGGAESPRQIRSLWFDRAFPATALSGESKAVFIVHETEIDGARERRLSTRLVTSTSPGQPRLLPPDAGDLVDFGIENLVVGNFHAGSVASAGAVRDLALVRQGGGPQPDEIVLVENDGFGGFPRLGNSLVEDGILAGSLTLLPAPAGAVDGLVFALRDSRLGFWRHDLMGGTQQNADALTGELRLLANDPLLAASPIDDRTRVALGDVDGDGIDDLVVLLAFDLPAPSEGQARLALLRGKAAWEPTEFPFHVPTALTPVHGNASALALGDFAAAASGVVRLEVAVAVPSGSSPGQSDGDHVRFFRYEAGPTPADDRLVPSAAGTGPSVLLAGSAPSLLAAGDFDRDGLVDLLVACRGDSTLRVYRNRAAPGANNGEVDIGAFVEGLGSPRPLAIGQPTRLRLGDLNGDGQADAVVIVEFVSTTSGARSTSVAFYLSSGTGEFSGPRFASPTRIGNRDARLAGDLGDWNRDGVPDLFVGWNDQNAINLRILFGGTR
jgi:hypothetical protein